MALGSGQCLEYGSHVTCALRVRAMLSKTYKLWLARFVCLFPTALSAIASQGEYMRVWSQKDAELADLQKEREAQELCEQSQSGELKELKLIYISEDSQKALLTKLQCN
jgi:hypothetical protein